MITTEMYETFDRAAEAINQTLFGGSLTPVIITFQRQKRSRAYYSPGRFNHRHEEKNAAEMALNPDLFDGRTDKEILSTVAHELAHHWQSEHGEPARGRYHNKEWGSKMDEIGLTPTDTGLEGGKRTGDNMTHLIVEGGPFDKWADEWLAVDGNAINWQSIGCGGGSAGGAKKQTRAKYTCPSCGLNAWAKFDAKLVCGECEEELLEE